MKIFTLVTELEIKRNALASMLNSQVFYTKCLIKLFLWGDHPSDLRVLEQLAGPETTPLVGEAVCSGAVQGGDVEGGNMHGGHMHGRDVQGGHVQGGVVHGGAVQGGICRVGLCTRASDSVPSLDPSSLTLQYLHSTSSFCSGCSWFCLPTPRLLDYEPVPGRSCVGTISFAASKEILHTP